MCIYILDLQILVRVRDVVEKRTLAKYSNNNSATRLQIIKRSIIIELYRLTIEKVSPGIDELIHTV